MKYILLLSLAFFVISAATPVVGDPARVALLESLFNRGLPKKIEFSQQLKSQVEGIMRGAGLGEMGAMWLQTGNLQEIIWQLREAGAEQQSEELTLLLQDTLENALIVKTENIGVGRTGAQLVEFANGLRGVFKTANDDTDKYIREVMVYNFDRLIGTNVFPLTTLRVINGMEGSMQLFMENSASLSNMLINPLDGAVPGISNAKTLKLLTLDSDTISPENYMFTTAGRIVAIDGSRAFGGGKDAVKKIATHLLERHYAYNLDPNFVARLKQAKNSLMSSDYWKEFKDINFVKKAIDEYVATAPTVDHKSFERLRTVLQHGEFDTARDLLDNGLIGDQAALDNALASHDTRVAEWLLQQGYQHDPTQLAIQLNSAIENANWEFVDWVLLEKKLDFYVDRTATPYFKRNIEDYLHIAWQRDNFEDIFKWASDYISNFKSTGIQFMIIDNLKKKYFKNAMFILSVFNEDIHKEKFSVEVRKEQYKELAVDILVEALKEKNTKIIKQLANDVGQALGSEVDFFLENRYIRGSMRSRLPEKSSKLVYVLFGYETRTVYYKAVEWVLDNGFFTDESFFNMVNEAIEDGNVTEVRFLLRKYFATTSPIKITEGLLEKGKDDIAKHWLSMGS